MVIICWCGHIDKYHSTGIPNNCSKCESCEYFRPRGNSTGNYSNKQYSNKPILAKFDGICKVCKLKITAKKHQIIRNSKGVWIHESCNDSTN